MEHMFFMAEAFNQPLGDWDVSALINARWVFERAYSFNQPLNNWDVSKVTDMHYMFSHTRAFNQTLSLWDVSAVTNMFGMFAHAKAFNSPLFNSPLNWGNRLSGGPSLAQMFQGALLFNQDLRSSWNISAITDNQNMWDGASVMSDSNKPCTTNATNAHPLYWPAC
jgi:surface protein